MRTSHLLPRLAATTLYITSCGPEGVDVTTTGTDSSAVTVVGQFGSFGTGTGQFLGINGIGVDDGTGRIYVTDAGNLRVQVWNPDLTHAFDFGNGTFTASPCGILIDRANSKVYVAEGAPGPQGNPADGNRIRIFDLAGNLQSTFGSPGNGNGQFSDSCQMAFFGNTLLVADGLNNRLQQFGLGGNFMNAVGVPTNVVSGVAVHQNRIFVSDSLGDRILEVNTSGGAIATIGSPGSGNGQLTRPSHLFAGGLLYVADGSNNRVQVFTYSGTFIEAFNVGTVTFGIGGDRNDRIFTDAQSIVQVLSFDDDGDGLLNAWETNGLDVDANGSIDIDLPALGANPNHKDLFWEVDWMLNNEVTRADVQAIKQAFAQAPVNAGGIANPDGLPGINIWVDTGSLTDPNAAEDGAALGTCSDGIDNGGGGGIDANDPDCLVGDNFGGGTQIPTRTIDNLGSNDNGTNGPDFYEVKGTSFNPQRAMVFRYHISASPPTNPSGGWGEIGGNDTIEYNHDPGTRMHEWGHNLNLGHGGFDSGNCKPTYVSVMNYDNQFGIRRNAGFAGQDLNGDGVDDGSIIDFSPPRFPGGRAAAPLATIAEDNLDETAILDATDPANQFAYVNSAGQKTRAAVNTANRFNADADTTDTGLSINVDTVDTASNSPQACANNAITANPPGLAGYDDWTNMSLPFRQFGDAANAPLNQVDEPSPTTAELRTLEEAFNTTDLAISKGGSPDPVEIGDPLTYTIVVYDNGPNPADQVTVMDTLPPEVSLLGAPMSCAESMGVLVCDLTGLTAGASAEVVLTVDTSDACAGGVPVPLSNTASVENVTANAGADLLPDDNTTTISSATIDTTPPQLDVQPSRDTLWPPNHDMQEIIFAITVIDECDEAPTVRLISATSSEPDDSNGDGHTQPDIQGADLGAADTSVFLRAERRGGGPGREYTLVYEAEDGSGNTTSATVTVTVPHDQGE